MKNCTLCHNTGWVLELQHYIPDKITLELIPCLIPDCDKSGQEIRLISMDAARFTHAIFHPKEEFIMSVSK